MRLAPLIVLAVMGAGACAPPRSVTNARAGDVAGPARDGELRIADLGTCTLESGATIEECRIGYRAFGKLDAKRSNLVLCPTYFTGTTASLLDVVPDRLVDTKRFYLVLVDALGDGVSSSPSISRMQPRLRFPKFTIRDMIETQRRLVHEVLGVGEIHTVIGISMGGMQAMEWGVSHPDEVGRIVPIVGTPQLTAHDLLLWNTELGILDGSKAYASGDYALPRPPIPALQEVHWMMLSTPAARNADTTRAAFPGWMAKVTNETSFDWNDWHRQLEAMIAHDVAHGGDLEAAAHRVRAKGLVVVAEQDQMVSPEPAKIFAHAMNAKLVVLPGPCGHAAPACDDTLAPTVRHFLEE
jgi:homoserine O-acetyltransferase